MESQSQDFHVLTRVKRKRNKEDHQVSSGVGRYGSTPVNTGRSLGSFIQSALNKEDEEESVKGEQAATGSRGGGGGSKKGSSRARKKLKWGKWERLGPVKWPGFEEEEGKEESAEIQTYSDSDSDPHEEVKDLDEIEEYSEQAGRFKARAMEHQQSLRKRGRRRQSRGPRREWQVSTSTPCWQNDGVAAENIDEFESDSDGSCESTHSEPHTSVHIATPTVHRKSITKVYRPPPQTLQTFIDNCESTSEHMNIATPPSSPEASISDLSRTKTSDWIKQVALESLESSRGCDTSHINDTTMRTPYHNDSSSRRGRAKKLVPGGLAEQLQRVIQYEASEITFWEHRAKKLEDQDIDSSNCLTVHVLSLTNCYSLFTAQCRVLDGSPIPQVHTSVAAVGKERTHDTTTLNVEGTSWTRDLNQPTEKYQPENLSLLGGSAYPLNLNRMESPTKCGYSSMDTDTQARELYSGVLTLKEVALRGLHSSFEGSSEMGDMDNVIKGGGDVVRGVDEVKGCGGGGGGVVMGDAVAVLFSLCCAKFLNLRVGMHVRIHPPWQCLALTPYTQSIVLCTHFCQSVGYTPPPESPTSPIPCKQRWMGGVYNLLSPERVSLGQHSMLVKSPGKGLLPTRLFLGMDRNSNSCRSSSQCWESCDETGEDIIVQDPPDRDAVTVSARTLIAGDHGKSLEEVTPCSLIEGLESAHGGVVSFTGRVVRVYRRKVATGREYREEGRGSVSMYQSFMQSVRQGGPVYMSRWVLLLSDSCGMFAELQVTAAEERHPQWCELIRSGEGKTFHFTNTRVIQRTTPSRNPEVFSLISSLHIHTTPLSKAPVNLASPQSSNTSDWDSHFPSTLPLFCYMLVCQSDSQILPCNDTKCFPSSFTPSPTTGLLHSDRETTLLPPSRVNLLARVVHIQLEVPQETDEDGRLPLFSSGPQCGYYLFVVTMTTSGVTMTTTQEAQKTVRVYLKSGFSVAGLQKVLTLPGAKVLLRDVLCETRDTDGSQYSMDACSLVVPVHSTSLELDPGVNMKWFGNEAVYFRPICNLTITRLQAATRLVSPDPFLPERVGSEDVTITKTVYPRRVFSSDELRTLSSLTTPHLPPLGPSNALVGSLVQLTGCVKGVDEENAYSWPACDICGNGKLSSVEGGTGSASDLYCDDCQRTVSSPTIHLQLTAFIQCPQLDYPTVCVQLLQSTIRQVLPVTAATVEDGFDVHQVLNRELSLQACYILEAKEMKGITTLFLEEVDIQFGE